MHIDLQIHSTYSDGYLTPTQLAELLFKNNVKVASLTDHNTVAGLDEFKLACKKYKIKSINGIELYVKYENKFFNIIWYNFKDSSPEIHKLLRDTQIRRKNKLRKILLNLTADGFNIPIDKIIDKYNHYIPINHVIDDITVIPANKNKILKELGKLIREEDIIHAYFNKKFGSLTNSYINLERVINLKRKIGGQLVLNHPGKYYMPDKTLFIKLKNLGIEGIEVLSPHHSIGAVLFCQYIARELNFIETGGSDFHRHEGNRQLIQNSWQYYKIQTKLLKGIEKIIGKLSHYA